MTQTLQDETGVGVFNLGHWKWVDIFNFNNLSFKSK